MPTRPLPSNPDLGQLRTQARELQRAVRAGAADAVALVGELHPRFADADGSAVAHLSLADAQLTVARSYGFASWPALRRHLDVVRRYSRSPHAVAASAPSPAAIDHRVAGPDDLLRLAVLTFAGDPRPRQRRADELLAARPDLGRATVHTAAATGDVAATRVLLAEDPTRARQEGGPFGFVPLLYLTYSRLGGSGLEVARLLLDAGADPDAGYLWDGLPSPFTALTGALGGGENGEAPHPDGPALARLLLAAGADANDSQAMYNLSLAGAGDDPAHLELLFEFGLGRGDGGPWHRRMGGAHPSPTQLVEDELLRAAEHGWPRRAAVVLAHGVDVHGLGTRHPTRRGLTAWSLAMHGGHTEVVELLAAAGAAPAQADPVLDLLAALMRADRAEVARLRAAHPGIDAEVRDRVPDHLAAAAARGRTDAVALMAELGWDVDTRRRDQAHHQTALHDAAWHGHLDTVRLLIGLGADPSVEDASFHATALGWAEHAGRDDVVAFLAGVAPG